MINSLDFVGVPSQDAERSRSFYIDTLGLKPDEHGRFEFWVGETCFGIWEPEKMGMEFAPQRNAHPALHVDDVAATRAELEAKGVEFTADTFDTGVCHMALFRDPDGNDMMLHNRYAPYKDGPIQKEEAMKYMLLIHQGSTPTPPSAEWDALSDAEKGEIVSAYKEISATPGVSPGLQLQGPETATTVRVQDGKTLTTDGPFAELKEAIGGYMLFEADDLDAAIELASRVPAARLGGAIEVRPIVEW
jgi:catechol 2,3-dioxygenase-like lactoylglutathione lyase family enzyme